MNVTVVGTAAALATSETRTRARGVAVHGVTVARLQLAARLHRLLRQRVPDGDVHPHATAANSSRTADDFVRGARGGSSFADAQRQHPTTTMASFMAADTIETYPADGF